MVVGLLAAGGRSGAVDIDATPDTYSAAVTRLRAGDTLRLAGGDYREGLRLHGLAGRADAPIRIVPADERARPVFHAAPGRNTISISNAAHVEIVGLDLRGHGVAVDAVKAEGTSRFADHITLQGLRISGYSTHQQIVGISTKCPAVGWVIRGNVISDVGTGIYLGNSDGSAPFRGGLIEGNIVGRTTGYNLQIKHQNALGGDRPDPGAMVTVIRSNVFDKSGGGSTGSMARPNVLVGAQPESGPGAGDAFVIVGNLFFGNPTEALFQGEGNLSVFNNLFVNRQGSAIVIRPHHGQPRDVELVANTVIARDVGILFGGGHAGHSQRIEGNAVFAQLPIRASIDGANNVVDDLARAGDYVREPEGGPGAIDLSPLARLFEKSKGIAWSAPRYLGGDADLLGRRRDRHVAGALVGPMREVRGEREAAPDR